MSGGHIHSHAPSTTEGHSHRLAVVLGVASVVLVIGVVGAAISGSLALVAAHLARRPATPQRTWGYLGAEVLAAAAQAAVLLAVGGFVLVEGFRRLLDPPAVASLHDLHASQVATNLPVLTAHVVVDDSCFLDAHLPELLD